MFGGLATAMYETLFDNHEAGPLERLSRASLPGSIVGEFIHMGRGTGRYYGLNRLEKAAEFFRNRFAITPAIGTAAAAAGLSDENPKLTAALHAYGRWRREHPPKAGARGGFGSGPTGEAFRFIRDMKKFHVAATRGEEDEAMKWLADALDVKAEELGRKAGAAVAESIRGRKVLDGLDEDEYDALRKHVGPEAFDQLEEWDATLEGWARTIKPKAIRRGGGR
jgi:hypothetical protein